MKADDLIAFIIEEAHYCVINDNCTKSTELALAAQTKNSDKNKGKKRITCKKCGRPGHGKPDCYQKGRDKEGQAPWQQKADKGKETDIAVVGADDDENEMFVFTCLLDYADVANGLDILKSKLGTCVDSDASRDYCPNCSKFTNYKEVCREITMADGRTLTAVGMEDLHIELPNGSRKTKVTFKNAIHAPGMAFTLISISRLDKGGYSVLFSKGMCTIQDPKGRMIATIPHNDGLYKLVANQPKKTETANTASMKMSINKAHRKLGHIAHSAIKYAITKGIITGIKLDLDSKVEFCEACAEAKLVCQLFPKELDTRAESMMQLDKQNYTYFQEKKSQTFLSYM